MEESIAAEAPVEVDAAPAAEATPAPAAVEPAAAPAEAPSGQVNAAPEGHHPSVYDPSNMTGQQAHDYWQPLYTRRSQEASEHKQLADQFKQVQQNPRGYIEQYLASQGLQIGPAQTQQQSAYPNQPQYDEYGDPVQQQQQQAPGFDMSQIQQMIQSSIQQAVVPLHQAQYQSTLKNVIGELDREFPGWQMFEQDIMGNLQRYPGMAQDIAALIDISVPKQVKEARYLQNYRKNTAQKQELGEVAGADPTPRVESTEPSTAGDAKASWRKAMADQGLKSTI